MLLKDLPLILTRGVGVLLTNYADPMDILNGRVSYERNDISQSLLGATDLFAVLARDGILIGVIVILALLISMLFVKKSEKLAERKADILHKLLIIFLIASLVTILNLIVWFFDQLLH